MDRRLPGCIGETRLKLFSPPSRWGPDHIIKYDEAIDRLKSVGAVGGSGLLPGKGVLNVSFLLLGLETCLSRHDPNAVDHQNVSFAQLTCHSNRQIVLAKAVIRSLEWTDFLLRTGSGTLDRSVARSECVPQQADSTKKSFSVEDLCRALSPLFIDNQGAQRANHA